MKGWIKVHGEGGKIAIPVRAIQTVQKSEHNGFNGLIQTNAVGNIYFEEKYEEVLALIEEAENGEEKTTPVAVIEADRLLDWLEKQKKESKSRIRTASTARAEGFHTGSLFSISEVIRHVERKTYLVDKPADREGEE